MTDISAADRRETHKHTWSRMSASTKTQRRYTESTDPHASIGQLLLAAAAKQGGQLLFARRLASVFRTIPVDAHYATKKVLLRLTALGKFYDY